MSNECGNNGEIIKTYLIDDLSDDCSIQVDQISSCSTSGLTIQSNVLISGITTLNGVSYYNNTATSSNEIVNYGLLTSFTQNTDTYVTGFTYDDSNNLVLSQTQGESDLVVNISIMSGLTINGDLIVNGDSILQDLSASTLSIINIDTGTTSNNVLVYNDITKRVEKVDNICFGNLDGGTAFSILLDLNIDGGGA